MAADRFDLVNSATGQPIMSGLDLVLTALPDTHARIDQERRIADSAAALGRAEAAIQAREAAVRAEAIRLIVDRAEDLARRLDAYTTRRDARRRRAEAKEQERIQHALDALPDPDAPGPLLTAPADDQPGADLTAHPPPDEERNPRRGGRRPDRLLARSARTRRPAALW
jgi:hypothetical protein